MTRRSSVRKLRTDSSLNIPLDSAISPPFVEQPYYFDRRLLSQLSLTQNLPRRFVAPQHHFSNVPIFSIRSRVENGLVTYRSAPMTMPLFTSTSRPFAESMTTFMPAHSGRSRMRLHTS